MHRETERSQDSKSEMEARTFTGKKSPATTSNNTNIGMLKCCWEFQHPREEELFGDKAAGNARWEGKTPALGLSFHCSSWGLCSLPSPGSCAHSSCAPAPQPQSHLLQTALSVPRRGLKPVEDLILIHSMSLCCLATASKALGRNHCHPLDHHSLNFHPL